MAGVHARCDRRRDDFTYSSFPKELIRRVGRGSSKGHRRQKGERGVIVPDLTLFKIRPV
jgi:hypothetical protein